MCKKESSIGAKNKITRNLLKSTAKRHRDDTKLYTVTRIIIEKCKLRFTHRALIRQRIFLPQNNHFVIIV